MEPEEFDFEFVRGDTCPLTFTLTDGEGNELEDITNAEVYFTVKDSFGEANAIFQKTYSGGSITKEDTHYKTIIEPSDTNTLDYGTYVYDICLVTTNLTTTLVRGQITLTNEATFIGNE